MQLSKRRPPLCHAPGTPKLPVAKESMSFWKSTGPLDGTAQLHHHRPWATCRKKHKLEENRSHTLSSTPWPVPWSWVLWGGLPSPGNLGGIRAVSQAVGRGGNRAPLTPVSSFLRSFSHTGSFPSTQMHPGERGRVVHTPPGRNWGKGRGEQRRPNSEEKLCLGKAVALIQNDPLKRAMKGFLLWLIDS